MWEKSPWKPPNITCAYECSWTCRGLSVCLSVCRMLESLSFCCTFTGSISINSMTTLYILWSTYNHLLGEGWKGGYPIPTQVPTSYVDRYTVWSDIGTMRICRPAWSLAVQITGTEYRFKTWYRRMRRVIRRRRVVTETENGTALKVLRQCPFVHLAFCTRQWTRASSVTKACLLILSRKIICLHCENHNETHKYTLYRFYIFSLLSGHVFYVRSKPTRKSVW